MKISILYLSIFSLLVTHFAVLLYRAPNPEEELLGSWKEVNWVYEKVAASQDTPVQDSLPASLKDKIGKNLLLHTAETWEFMPGGQLLLKGSQEEKQVQWCLKGRGHILEIRHGLLVEHYNVTQLGKGRIVLNFESDMQIKGLAQLTFEKT